MYYIYRFLNKEQEDIYIGITNDIRKRINQQHFTSIGHLNYECYKDTEYVIYSKCESKDDAKIKETYLINKINPKYNVIYTNSCDFKFIIDDFEWKYIPFNKEKFFKSIESKKQREINNSNMCKDISKIHIPNNIVTISLKAKLNKQNIGIIKFKGLESEIVFRYKGIFQNYNINALKINNELYFVFHNIDDICRSGAATTSNILSYMVSRKIIQAASILAVEDRVFIENSIISHTLNERNQYLFPKKIYLINSKSFINVYDYLKPNRLKFKSELYTLLYKWVQINFKVNN